MRPTYFATTLVAVALCSAPACRWRDRDDDASRANGDDSSAPSKASRFSLQFEGAEVLDFERRSDELVITTAGGKGWGTLELEGDRVKLEQDGKEAAKAKVKEYGFKVYDGDLEVFKVKRKKSGYEVRRPDDTELGRFEERSGRFASDAVTLESSGEAAVLKRGGHTLVTVRGPLSSNAVFMLAATEATLPQRLVMATIVEELLVPK